MRILALVPGGIDDQILFFPTLETLKKQYPKAAIDVIVEPRAKSAYRICSSVHEVLVFDFKDRNGLADYLNLLGIIRDREYEVVLSLGKRWTIELMLWLNGIPTRVGYKTNTSWFLSNAVPVKPQQYKANAYHDLLQGLGIQTPCPELKVTLPREDIDWAETTQKHLDLKDRGYILIHGNTEYPLANWKRIIDDIQQKQPDLGIVLLQQSEQDKEWIDPLIENYPNVKTINPPDVGKLAGAIAAANLILCTSGVPLHLSIAVGTYTIALLDATQTLELLPRDRDSYRSLTSSSGKIADILPDTILHQVWEV